VFLNATRRRPAALRTGRTSRSSSTRTDAMGSFGSVRDLYFGGDLEAGIPLSPGGGRITASRPVAEVIRDCADGCEPRSPPGHPVRWVMTVADFLDEATSIWPPCNRCWTPPACTGRGGTAEQAADGPAPDPTDRSRVASDWSRGRRLRRHAVLADRRALPGGVPPVPDRTGPPPRNRDHRLRHLTPCG